MLGVEFDPLLPGDPKVTGEQVLPILFGVPLSHGKCLDLTILVILLFVHRLLLFVGDNSHKDEQQKNTKKE